MRFEDQPASGEKPASAETEPAGRPRRRTPRSWSTPATGERFDRPISDEDWAKEAAADPQARPSTPRARRAAEPPPPPPPGPDLGTLSPLLADLRAELGQLRAALEAGVGDRDTSLVTGAELAASIEALGASLGSGIANLLTEHRNLLARDIEGAAVRILEEITQRVRATGTQIVDGVEERVRHVNVKGLGDVVDQIDLRLDQLQTDMTGLRAVMLEIPDQTSVVERLDHLTESVGSGGGGRGRDANRLTPAMSAAIERSVSGPLERVEANLDSLSETVRELLDERLPEDLAEAVAGAGGGDGSFPSAAVLESLTNEMTALRRRISIRTDARGEAVELSDRQLDDLADRIVARMGDAEAPRPAKAAKAAKAAIRIEEDVEDAEDAEEADADVKVPRRVARKASKATAAKRASKRR